MKILQVMIPVAIGFVLVGFSVLLVDRQSFYDAFGGDSQDKMEQVLSRLQQEPSSQRNHAYTGALVMKKASFQQTARQKISEFKKGAQLLEDAIASSPENAEYRFLRLCVQEHAPKILKYKKDIESDKALIIRMYPGLNAQLKRIIFKYSQSSSILSGSDLSS